jgi:hypothetical protein
MYFLWLPVTAILPLAFIVKKLRFQIYRIRDGIFHKIAVLPWVDPLNPKNSLEREISGRKVLSLK